MPGFLSNESVCQIWLRIIFEINCICFIHILNTVLRKRALKSVELSSLFQCQLISMTFSVSISYMLGNTACLNFSNRCHTGILMLKHSGTHRNQYHESTVSLRMKELSSQWTSVGGTQPRPP